MSTPIVLDVIDTMKSNPDLLAAPGSVTFTSILADVSRPTVLKADDPLIVYAALDYKTETLDEAVKGWVEIVEQTEKTEPTSLVYMCLKDSQETNRVRMFEVYESQVAFEQHCKTDLVVKKMKGDERLRVRDPDVVFLKRVHGFLYKE
jgi:quinol monooxygenase YgiN